MTSIALVFFTALFVLLGLNWWENQRRPARNLRPRRQSAHAELSTKDGGSGERDDDGDNQQVRRRKLSDRRTRNLRQPVRS